MRGLGRGVPDEVVERAKAAFPLRAPPGELIPLTAAVFVDADSRQPAENRLDFERDGLSVRVRVEASEGAAQVQVDVDPREFQAVELEIHDSASGLHRVQSDVASSHDRRADQGSVTFLLPFAIVRLHIVGSPVSHDLYTEWFRL